MFALDFGDAAHRSLCLDGRILWRTVRMVRVRNGISMAGVATMAMFEGSTPQMDAISPDESIKYNRVV